MVVTTRIYGIMGGTIDGTIDGITLGGGVGLSGAVVQRKREMCNVEYSFQIKCQMSNVSMLESYVEEEPN